MKNILYIHGYNGSKNGQSATLIKKHLPVDYAFFAIDYDQTNAATAIKQISEFVEQNQIDLIVGSSLGAFLTLNLPGVAKIIYNPCYLPSVELPKIGCDTKQADTYKPYERRKPVDETERSRIYAIFSDDDELLGDKYRKLYAEDWSSDMVIVHGRHKISEESIVDYVIPAIVKMLS